ncbi:MULTISPECIES: LytR/AlgR family response regulator transcription factor [Arthrobacter]|uniref:DNA-binding response regulator n=1 Tax=Arthrobacter psychrochitiniphilus TaxID=291045 RepID=A0A2V3DVG2_9MICC|nr:MULTISPECIES: LytTR family DNA-binding domain-containing protein [Arthrobacter]NYG16784.1 DNA-binding LytR/AlgR family response regulator [Arthrobacter psychrochitiniphilus]PXA69123.1 DNA-binding response regulator [Arthrobacter psychrochitiniphilus]
MINVLVADDELPAIEELAFLLGRDPRVGTIHQAMGGAEALDLLAAHEVDAVFLDIHMPGLSGLELAELIGQRPNPPVVVFVTADDDRALEAFELAAIDYLLKPLRTERLTRTVDRVVELVAHPAAVDEVEMITVDQGGISRIIRLDEVKFVQAQGDYARLHTAEASYLIRVPLADLEQRWAEAGFLRIHRSYLVCMQFVTALRLSTAKPTVSVGSAVLPVSRRHVPVLRDHLQATRVRPAP